ncbi:hypothetical protein [Desulfogranum mediterraneum]|uniref:hypothetical protein n=1 Tax=Desulfogranum mediterraneum TaxID=160661 RepID=UPI0004269E7F|nr:hypothetical protein [Desulfogranum mediterraneum]
MKSLLIESLRSSVASGWLILKLVIPLYIIADVLLYFDLLRHISFLFTPITGLLHLPPEAAIALAGGVLLNIYAAIAFAAPLGLTALQWTILGVFLGICHALVVESAIMAKLGVSYGYSVILRLLAGFVAILPLLFLPDSLFPEVVARTEVAAQLAEAFWPMLWGSTLNALVLSVKIIGLISAIIVAMDLLKASPLIKEHLEKVNTSFSIIVGQLLGITYGATILIREARQGSLSQRDIFYISTFLMICHSIIEDVLLFVIFGANLWLIVGIRVVTAVLLSQLLLLVLPRVISLDRIVRPASQGIPLHPAPD